MRLPRLRLSVRGLMVTVALVGTVAGLVLDYEAKKYRYMQLQSFHSDRWMRALAEGNRLVEPRTTINPNGRTAINHPNFSEAIRARVDYHKYLVGKYEFAARTPWISVAPDPPEPPDPQ